MRRGGFSGLEALGKSDTQSGVALDMRGVVVRFDALERSVATMGEKRAHFAEVQETGARQGARAQEIERRATEYLAFEPRIAPHGARV